MTGYLYVRPRPFRDAVKNKLEYQRMVYKLDVLGAPYEPAEDGYLMVYVNSMAHFNAITDWDLEVIVQRHNGKRYHIT